MFEHLINGESLGWVFAEHAFQQVFGFAAQAGGVRVSLQVQWLRAYQALANGAVFVVKRDALRQQDVHQRAETPDITTRAVGVAAQDFWGHVPRRADFESGLPVWRQ